MSTGGRVRRAPSLGASLLDQVLAETLDPAYRQAAEARAARKAGTAETGQVEAGNAEAARSARSRRAGEVLVALVLAATGLLLAVTYIQASTGARGRAQVRAALLADIVAENARADRLAADLERLRPQVERTRDSALAASSVGQEALDRLSRAEQAAAAVGVTGPGLRVTLANARSGADSDPVGKGSQGSPGGRVRDADLQLVVNALWAAGAEAVSINGQRLGPTSTIRTAGEAILVDFRPVANPYQVSAVGDTDTLATRFLANPEVGGLAVVSQSYGLRFEFSKDNHLTLPPATPSELRYAAPLAGGRTSTSSPSPGG